MDRRRFLLTLLAVLAVPLGAETQQPGKIHRVGLIASTTHFTPAFRQGLRELGYVEGENITIEERSTQGQSARFPELVAEAIRMRVDVLVVSGIAAALAARNATTAISIVFVGVADPVGQGLVASLGRPGANVTGTSLALGEGFAGKWVELLKEAVPRVSRAGVLWNSTNPAGRTFVSEVHVAAQALRVSLELMDVRNPGELDGALTAIAGTSVGGLIVTADPLFFAQRAKLVQFANSRRVPAIYFFRDFAEDGGLIAYGPSLAEAFRRAASYVDRILKGAKPAELPIEQPTKFDLAVNLKTAKALGLTIPPSLLARADQLIE